MLVLTIFYKYLKGGLRIFTGAPIFTQEGSEMKKTEFK